jgi:GntR family transcriptional regulator/MocR family aminotransferase
VHRGPTPPALHARDRADRVLLMGTLEGVLFPALRIAYLVVPPRLVDVFVAARGLLGDHTQTTGQLALAGFIDGGHLTAHLRRLQERVGARRDALRQAVRRWLPAAAILSRTDSGLHACLHLPPEWPDHEVVQALRRRGVGGEALSSRCWQATGLNGLIVGYGADEPERIDAAVRVIGEVLEGMAVAEDADGA